VYYEKLKSNLLNSVDAIGKDEQRQILTAVLNYCNRNHNRGHKQFLKEMFDWYKELLSKEMLIENGFFAPYQHFRNMVVVSLLLNELAWTENFIEKYKEYLNPNQKDKIVNYCLAEFNFYKKDYDQTFVHLEKFNQDNKDTIQSIEHKRLLSKTYFETDNMDVLQSTTKAFDEYMRRKKPKVSQQFWQSNKNYIKVLKELTKKVLDPNYRISKKAILEEIATMQFLTERKWLTQTIEQLYD